MKFSSCTLSEVIELVIDYRGKTPKKLGGDWSSCGYRALSAKNIKTGSIVQQESIRYVDKSLYQKWMKDEVKRGDILITSEAPFGQIYYWNSDEKIVLSQRIFGLRVNNNFISKYIYYYMTTTDFQAELAARATGTTVIGLRQPELLKCKIKYPDIKSQKIISDILSSLDDKIELNNRINKNLEEQAMAIYKSWFVDFEPFGGKMPKDWEYIKLQQIADFISGYSYKGKELVKSKSAMATIKNFDRGGGFKMDGYKEITPSNNLKDEQFAKVFDILVAHTDLTQNADIIGNTEMIMSDLNYKKIIFSMDIVKVLPQKNIPHFVLASILKSENFKKHCLGYINGTTVLHLSKKALPDYELPFPKDIKKLSNIENLLKKHYLQIANNINENYKLNQIRDVLLPKLMNGEIDTSKIKI